MQMSHAKPKLIPVVSLKGGCGKSFVSGNLALALTHLGFKVGAIDADYHAPNLHVVLDSLGTPTRGPGDLIIPPTTPAGIKFLSWAMIWPEESAVLVEDSQITVDDVHNVKNMIMTSITHSQDSVEMSTEKYDAILRYLDDLINHPGGAVEHIRSLIDSNTIQWGELDYLIVDTPPEVTGVMKAIACSSNVWGCLIITHPSKVSLADTKRTMNMFQQKHIPLLGIVSNQGTQDGVDRYDLTDKDIQEFAAVRQAPFIMSIPHISSTAAPSHYFEELAQWLQTHEPVYLPKVEDHDVSSVAKLMKISRIIDRLTTSGGRS